MSILSLSSKIRLMFGGSLPHLSLGGRCGTVVPGGVGHLWPQCLAPRRVGAFRGPGAIDSVPGQWPGSIAGPVPSEDVRRRSARRSRSSMNQG